MFVKTISGIIRIIIMASVFSFFFSCGNQKAVLGMGKIQEGETQNIRLNSAGFLPLQTKSATISGKCAGFEIIDSDGKAVYSGTVTGPYSFGTNETDYIADFTPVTNKGIYYIRTGNIGRSYSFRIGDDIYYAPYKAAMLGMYLWRCGTDVSALYNGNTYSQKACHLNDADQKFIGGKGLKDGTGGWHDAGDYNKYTVNTGVTVGMLFMTWEHFAKAISNITLTMPENANSMPDFLDELKWEMDWILKMQYPDGSGRVSHKLSAQGFCGFIMPDLETATRYYVPWGSAATADFVAMTAMAARIFKPYNAAYASKCSQAAKLSYSYLMKNQKDQPADQSAFSTGKYESPDIDDRLWAAAEMWETFGDTVYLKDFEKRARGFTTVIDVNWDWNNVKNLGMFTYLLSSRKGKNKELFSSISNALLETADSIVKTARSHPYRRPLGSIFHWGCNGSVARQTMVLQIANKFSPNADYVNTSLDALGYLFGRNCFNRSFITGVGYNPPMFPHDRRSGADGIEEPWPGYLVGGGWPDETSWRDEQGRYDLNEIAINWNGALIYALAGFVSINK